MPQLRDSSNTLNGSAAGRPTAHVGAEHADGFARIFGVETEYGVSVTGAKHPVDPGQVAMTMFRPVVSRSRSTNTYLVNGSRLYLDVGSHPEYATAEAVNPMDALAQDLAGEHVMRRLGLEAQARLRESTGEGTHVHLFKNNVDSAGHSFGCHENYLLRRQVPLSAIETELIPFLVTRVLFTGAGRFTGEDGVPDGFEITQRADFLDDAISSSTTRSRPMVNTRDEPHADSDLFRRLHVIVGDSNRSQTATWMKLAVTHLVLCAIEEAYRAGAPSGFEEFALADPSEAIRTVSRDRTGRARFALASGETSCALDVQRRYLALVSAFVAEHDELFADAGLPGSESAEGLRSAGAAETEAGEAVAYPAGLSRQDVSRALTLWAEALDAVESGEWRKLASWVDWAAKLQLIEALRRRDPSVDDARLRQIDMDYHDIVNGTVYERLVRAGMMQTMIDEAGVRHAVEHAPANTRAALRGEFVRRVLEGDYQWSCDWTHVAVTSPVRLEAELLDPFSSTPTPAYTTVLKAL
ncbi:proteasome accessory factor PafA2 family protein [Bifidobacterium simiarum]|uniref:proteasome accessory factor PafA2 family protein n=1 Tax=Bifidobacterium simiarum TaxID=2045441 RepID=UPI00269F1B5B